MGKLNLNVISIKRLETKIDAMGNPQKDERIIQPSASVMLQKDDVLVVIGRDEDIDRFKEF